MRGDDASLTPRPKHRCSRFASRSHLCCHRLHSGSSFTGPLPSPRRAFASMLFVLSSRFFKLPGPHFDVGQGFRSGFPANYIV
jgi:hypothetical protein